MFLLILSLSSLTTSALRSPIPTNTNSNNPATWTPLDTSEYTIDAVGEKIGSLQGQSFAGWYTDTVVVDPGTGTIVVAWARWDADSDGNDYIYLAFLKPIDADGDSSPEAYQKIVKEAGVELYLKSLDSLTIGTINGQKYVLLTWTYYDTTEKNNVAGALYSIDGTKQWSGNIRSTTDYEEHSRSCYVPAYNNNDGGFLIIWYTNYDDSIDGKWLYYDTTNGWTLTSSFDITSTNSLYYTKADQMLCIGGNNKALVVYRVWNSTEGYPDLYAALVDTSNNVQIVELYDDDRSEETVGVRGAYTNGYFIVPLVSGSHLRYDIVSETDGTVTHRDYVTSNGEHPYAIALNDRFVLAWIDHYKDSDGEPKIANIDLTNFYIHPQYGVSITGGDNYYDKHPLIAYDPANNKIIYVWSNSTSENGDYDISYAIISPGTPTSDPSIDFKGVLIKNQGDQRAHGLGLISKDQYVVVYNDTSDGEEDLLAYVALPDVDELDNVDYIKLYKLPKDADAYYGTILSLINNADKSIYIAVAYFQEGHPGDPGTISAALVDAKNRGVDVRVIIDNATNNLAVYQYLESNGVDIINDSSINDATHIMHDKFMIVDNKIVVVATVNFITQDFYQNNNTAILINSSTIAYFYTQEFLHMWNNGNGRFGEYKTDDHSFIAFINYNTRTIVFEGYFGPQYYGDWVRIPNTIAGYINRTTSDVYFAAYIFTTSGWVTSIYDTIISAYDTGKTVRGVFDESMNVDSPGKRLYWFLDNKVPVAIDNHPYLMHAKLFVVDNSTAVIGSWNPTTSATLNHDENILIIRDPDTTNGFAKRIADYILSMYNDAIHFVKAPYVYTPTHLIITKVMFYPDTSNEPTYEWVEIHNPTNNPIDLTNYVIGDVDNLLGDTDPEDGLYVFPDGAIIPPGGYIVIAYDATAFYETYGFKPTYEISGTDPDVPDLVKYDTKYGTNKFPGNWNLSDTGDEVILGVDVNGFIKVIDAVWYGSSTYMGTDIPPGSYREPLDISGIDPGSGIVIKDPSLDAVKMSDKYTISKQPQPVPENPYIVIISVIASLLLIILIISEKKGKLSN